MSRRSLVLLGLAALAVFVPAVAAPYLSRGEGWYFSVPVFTAFGVAGGSFLGVGLVAAWRRPRSRVGLLMMAVGLTWFVGQVGWIPAAVPWSMSQVLGDPWMPVLAHLAVSFPSGRLGTARDRLVVAVAYGWYLVSTVVNALTWHPVNTQRWGHNVFGILGDQHLNDELGKVTSVISVIVIALVVVTVFDHWRHATPPGRRVLAPMAWVSAPIGGWLAAKAISGAGLAGGGLDPLLSGVFYITAAAVPFGFLAGLQRAHLGRGAVGELIVRLGSRAESAERLDAALARVLGDPSIRVLYRVSVPGGSARPGGRAASASPGDPAYVDASGQPAQLPDPATGQAVTAVDVGGEPVAVLVHDPSLLDEPELIEATVAAARLAIDNARLQAEVRAQLAEVRASRARILHAGDVERQRIERNLHDGAQQRLVMLAFALRAAQARAGGDAELAAALTGASQELKDAIAELRTLAQGLHPAVLIRSGLAAAVESAVRRSPVPAELTEVPQQRFAPEVEAAAYYVVSEALANAGKHAKANSVRVAVCRSGDILRVEVADDGAGGADVTGSGLTGLADRVAVAGGTLTVVSPKGAGTAITAELPCGAGPG